MTIARARLAMFASALTLVMSACAGPQHPLNIGMKEISTDVLIGPNAGTHRPTPPPALSPTIAFPGFVQPPLPRFPQPSPQPSPVSCPTTGPITTITHPLASTAVTPPVATAYTYRNSGSYKLGMHSYPYPALSDRVITNVVANATSDAYLFDVVIPQPEGSSTTTTYHVYPSQASPADPAPGIYIDQIVTKHSDGSAQSFAPTPALEVIPFPAAVDLKWSVRSIDPLTQVLMQYDATISAEPQLDVCGKRMIAWQVDISNGAIRSPSSSIAFSGSVDIGTQYGGISLSDSLTMSGTDNGTSLDVGNTATITKEPEVAS